MLDEAFEALKKYDWGADMAPLAPIEEAVTASHGKADARQDLENRLLGALKSDISRDAKDYVCRKLTIVGTAASAPTLAGLLGDENHSHMARYALERIDEPAAGQALRDALPRVSGKLKVGVISSLGDRGEIDSVAALSGLLADRDASVARAAATALGDIGSPLSAKALQDANPATPETRQAVSDALLACAEALLADNKQADALAIYKSLAGAQQTKLVRLAATRGMLACADKKE